MSTTLERMIRQLQKSQSRKRISPPGRLKSAASSFSDIAENARLQGAISYLFDILARQFNELQGQSPESIINYASYIGNYQRQRSVPTAIPIQKAVRRNEYGLIREQIEYEVLNHYDGLPLRERKGLSIHEIVRDLPKLGELVESVGLNLPTIVG